MKSAGPIWRLVLLAIGAVVATGVAAAQEQPILQDLHLSGSTAFTFERDTSGSGAASGFSANGYGEELNTQFQGTLWDPRFLDFATNMSLGRSQNNYYLQGSSSATILAGGINFRFLPASDYPLSFYYQRDSSGVGQQGFDSNYDTSNMGLDWLLRPKRLPTIEFRFNRNSSTNNVFTSIGDHNAAATTFEVNVHDTFKGWNWSANANESNSSSWADVLSSPVELNSRSRGVGAGLGRLFWDRKGSFNYTFSRTHDNQENSDFGHVTSDFTVHQADVILRPTERLTSTVSYQNYSSSQEALVPSATPGTFTFLPPIPFSTQALSGDVIYRLTEHISLSDGVRYSTADFPLTPFETTQSWFTITPAILATYAWHGVQLSGRYALQWDSLRTDRDRRFSAFAHTGGASASWGNARLVQLTAAFNIAHTAVPELAGAYVDTKQFSLSGETQRFQRIAKIRFRVDHTLMNSLTNPGLVDNNRTGWSVGLVRRRVQADFGVTSMSGVRQAFAVPTTVFQPLPVFSLIGVPLLDGITHDRFINVSAQVRRNLQVGCDYHNETNELRAGSIDFSSLNVRANYRVGKIAVDFAYGRYLNTSQLLLSSTQATSNLNRLRFRIARAFNLF